MIIEVARISVQHGPLRWSARKLLFLTCLKTMKRTLLCQVKCQIFLRDCFIQLWQNICKNDNSNSTHLSARLPTKIRVTVEKFVKKDDNKTFVELSLSIRIEKICTRLALLLLPLTKLLKNLIIKTNYSSTCKTRNCAMTRQAN